MIKEVGMSDLDYLYLLALYLGGVCTYSDLVLKRSAYGREILEAYPGWYWFIILVSSLCNYSVWVYGIMVNGWLVGIAALLITYFLAIGTVKSALSLCLQLSLFTHIVGVLLACILWVVYFL